MTRSALADFFGISLPTIDHWIRSGCPVVQRGSKGKPWEFNTADVAGWREQKARDEATGSVAADEAELKRRKLQAETARAELLLAKEMAEVAPVDQFQRAMANAFAEVKANMRNVPGRVVSLLIGESDEVRFKRVLIEEIDQALETLADASLVEDDDLDLEDFEDDDG